MDDVKKAASDAAAAVDKGLDEASVWARSALKWLVATANQGLQEGKGAMESGKVRLHPTRSAANTQLQLLRIARCSRDRCSRCAAAPADYYCLSRLCLSG